MASVTFVVGLTGGIGSGKSTVADLFAELGVVVIDTDAISHALTAAGGQAIPAIRAVFREDVIAATGEMDRAAVRALVFSDPAARKRLEGVLHPLIREAVSEKLASVADLYAILVVPLLVETGAYHERLDRILVVDCDETTQVQRVMARSQMSEAEVRAVIDAQAGRHERLRIADDVINNNGGRERLRTSVAALHEGYRKAALDKFARQSPA